MKHLLIVLLLAVYFLPNAQGQAREYGEITQEEIDLQTCKYDTDAEAVILFDIGKSIFFDIDGGYNIRFTRHKRIKIFKKSAFKFTAVSIPIHEDKYGNTEVIKSIQATTYNYENGKLVRQELDPTTIYEERTCEWCRNKKFVFPNVQEGSILEFKYVLETPFHFRLRSWTFQDKIPTVYSKYEVRMIPFYEYVFWVQGITKFDEQTSVVAKEKRSWGAISKSYGKNIGTGIEFQDYIHTYALKNIPAFKDESYISSVSDYIISMNFQLSKIHDPHGGETEILSTWEKLNESLLTDKNFGKYKKSCGKYAKRILRDELNISEMSAKEKSIKIIEYVKNNFSWNGSNSKYASQSAKDFFKTKSGNTADINLFLLALLNKAEIDADPVVLSTRDYGKINADYPFDYLTNCVVVLVDIESSFLADGTDNLLPYYKLPINYLNGAGLIVTKKDDAKWIMLESNVPSIIKNSISIEIDTQSLNANFYVSIASTDYKAYHSRHEFRNDTTAIKEFYAKKIGEINQVRTSGYKEIDRPYFMAMKGTYITEKPGGNIVINPFLNLAILKNKLTQKERKYPVDFICAINTIFDITLKIPKGFALVSLPESFDMNNELVEIKTNYAEKEGMIKIVGNYNFKKPVYTPREYANLKSYIDTMVKKFNDVIVLEKL